MTSLRGLTMNNGNMPAMPTKGGMMFYLPKELKGEVDEVAAEIGKNYQGLTKREHFAAMAMQGMVSTVSDGHVAYEVLASDAVRLADALLKALENNNE